MSRSFNQQLDQHGAWRSNFARRLQWLSRWLTENELLDQAVAERLRGLETQIRTSKVMVAFVAEFSRGKSELINAIFFAGYGRRIMPASAGRTTMCPTELGYDPALAPKLRLLPIETRLEPHSLAHWRDKPTRWTEIAIDVADAEQLAQAMGKVAEVRWVGKEEARTLGFWDDDTPDDNPVQDAEGRVEIPRWRHAVLNMPHPLLEQGLVILDTPGLNAIGTEPELTLNLIPSAHAVLFILAAETGVTKSDIEVWRTHIGPGSGRIVVLNKIDAMWDELKSDAENESEIERMQTSVAHMLALTPRQVYPVSAQKALVGKINGDSALLEKSRLGALEGALFNELIPAKQDIIRKQLSDDMGALLTAQQSMINTRIRDIVEQMQELKSLRGKNQNVIAHMMRRIDVEKKEFDTSLFKLQGTRAVFARLSTELYTTLGMDIVQGRINAVRDAMEASRFATGMRGPVKEFFDEARQNLIASNDKVAEISDMMQSMYKKFSSEHGLNLNIPMTFTLNKYRAEIDAIEDVYQKQFGTTTMILSSRNALMERFFDAIASRVRRSFRAANADVDAWLKVIMAPLEAQIRQHKEQLKHRLVSIQRIHDATDSLETKIESFEASQAALEKVKARLDELARNVTAAMGGRQVALEAAA